MLNALASIALADSLHIAPEIIRKGLMNFSGTDRRFQYKGEMNGFTIIDDYAHHPTEIKATLHAAQHYPHREIWCVFQPHTYTRTKAFFNDFAEALTLADHVVLADIYAAVRPTPWALARSSWLTASVNLALTPIISRPSRKLKNFYWKNVCTATCA